MRKKYTDNLAWYRNCQPYALLLNSAFFHHCMCTPKSQCRPTIAPPLLQWPANLRPAKVVVFSSMGGRRHIGGTPLGSRPRAVGYTREKAALRGWGEVRRADPRPAPEPTSKQGHQGQLVGRLVGR
jgi:hypothetical protein